MRRIIIHGLSQHLDLALAICTIMAVRPSVTGVIETQLPIITNHGRP